LGAQNAPIFIQDIKMSTKRYDDDCRQTYQSQVSSTIHAEWGLQCGALDQHHHDDLARHFTPSIQALIEEINAATQASPVMIATLALGAIAAAVQGLYDVQRPHCDATSTSLFCLAIKSSGGGKTTVMNALLQPHVEFQRKASREQATDSEYEAELRAWKARVKACETSLRKHYDDSDKARTLTQQLKEIMREEAIKQKQATNILLKDTTTQALAQSMHESSPAVTIVSDEASIFFKNYSHELTSFNQGHDGADIKVDRRTGSTYFVQQPRLSLMLATQPRPFKKVMDEKGLDLIEIGFLPRTLVAMCEQDNGIRSNPRAVSSQARIDYYTRIDRLLDAYRKKLKSADLSRTVLTFSSEAQMQWEQTRKWLEWSSTNNGPLSNLREYAARCPEHIARIAANLHVIEGKDGTQIALDTMLHATLIVRWYAHQFQVLFGDLHMPQHERDAKAILDFLWAHYRTTRHTHFNIRWLSQYTWGGKELRSSMTRVRAAIEYLESRQVVSRVVYGKRCDVFLDNRFITAQFANPSGLFRPSGG
jgi:hypothetical protein